MSLIAWLITGLAAGLLFATIVRQRVGTKWTVVVAMVGAFGGGSIFEVMSASSGYGLPASMVAALAGAGLLLAVQDLVNRLWLSRQLP